MGFQILIKFFNSITSKCIKRCFYPRSPRFTFHDNYNTFWKVFKMNSRIGDLYIISSRDPKNYIILLHGIAIATKWQNCWWRIIYHFEDLGITVLICCVVTVLSMIPRPHNFMFNLQRLWAYQNLSYWKFIANILSLEI